MKYDVILLLNDNKINEFRDERASGVSGSYVGGVEQGVYGMFTGILPDSNFAYGPMLRAGLNLGTGYNVSVVDFGSDITCHVSYTSVKTGKSAGMDFLIKFASKKGNGVIKASSIRYRTIDTLTQAISYIRSRCSALPTMVGGNS